MTFFDVTKSSSARHRSGLVRLGERLREELGENAQAAAWTEVQPRAGADDWFVTTELFSEGERPGFSEFLRKRTCRTAAIFADAIPMKLPHITWPKSVARHPAYMKMLAGFERVWAISKASRDELIGYWRWLGLEGTPEVEVLPLGADLDRAPRNQSRATAGKLGLLCVGILEPRKNQLFLMDVCEELWTSGLSFDLHIVGRINPHFGSPVVARIKSLRKKFAGLRYHEAARDAVLVDLYSRVRATVFPTIAEGCGLPLLESLWHGVPCVCSDLPVLRENADAGGCLTPAVNSREAWRDALRGVLQDNALHARLSSDVVARSLPTWAETAQRLADGLREKR
jgi:glycosyltransferase involved in cell wall biosynthesis